MDSLVQFGDGAEFRSGDQNGSLSGVQGSVSGSGYIYIAYFGDVGDFISCSLGLCVKEDATIPSPGTGKVIS